MLGKRLLCPLSEWALLPSGSDSGSRTLPQTPQPRWSMTGRLLPQHHGHAVSWLLCCWSCWVCTLHEEGPADAQGPTITCVCTRRLAVGPRGLPCIRHQCSACMPEHPQCWPAVVTSQTVNSRAACLTALCMSGPSQRPMRVPHKRSQAAAAYQVSLCDGLPLLLHSTLLWLATAH